MQDHQLEPSYAQPNPEKVQARINFLDTQKRRQPPPRRPRHPRKRSPKRIFLLLIFLLIVGCVGKNIITSKPPNDPSGYDPVTLEEKKPQGFLSRIKHFVFSRDVTLEGQRDDRINILLLGMGGIGHDGPFLTDTMIIASVRPSEKKVAMVSIPRDLGVKIPGYGWRKINNANAFGEVKESGHGGVLAKKVVEQSMDIPIHYYVRIDFKAFEEIIDHLGGLTINVERSFTDTEYPAPENEYQTISFTSGVQTMNGSRALMYARSRHGNNGEGSDFARARRQQNTLLALKEKLLSFETLINPVRVKNIMDTLDKHLTTDMAFNEIVAMMKLGRELETNDIKTLVLDSSEGGYLQNGRSPDGAFILEPAEGNFDRIRNDVENIFDIEIVQPEIAEVPEQEAPGFTPTNVEIQNGTWRAGLAARLKKQLETEKFTVTDIGNTTDRPQLESGIYAVSDNAGTDVLGALKETLGIPVKETPPVTERAATSTDVLIILGENFEE